MVTVARILVDSPLPQLDRLFDYAVPTSLVGEVTPGIRVKVPLRTAGRVLEGYVVELVEIEQADRKLSEIDSIVSPVVVLPPDLYRLARSAADRAAGSAVDILRLVIPKRMVRAEKTWIGAPVPSAPEVDAATQEWARGVLAEFPTLTESILAGERVAVDAPPRPAGQRPWGAWAELLVAMTSVTLAAGKSVVVVLPDHRDHAQVRAALEGRIPDAAIVRNDADRSGPERYATYLRLRHPVPCVVIGNRSTVYAPAHSTGLVIVWDDGDRLLSEPLSPGVHARDAALVRQGLEGSALVFAGHTRTTDVERLVQIGWVKDIAAARRVSPKVVLSGTHEGAAPGQRVPSAAFAAAREALALGPVLIQVSRPGYAPVLVCAECRQPARCPHCAGPLHASRAGRAPDCGWCGRSFPNWTCSHCTSQRLRMASSGSERTADELGRAFPNTRVVVSDGAHPVTELDARPALVIATRGAEPVVAGGYRAVLLLDGDKMLLAEQLRIGESCLRWWSNAAALAAPGAPVHLVGVTGPVSRAFATWTQPAYARAELSERTPLHMPPVVRVATIEGTGASVAEAIAHVREEVPGLGTDAVLGPVPTPDGPASTSHGTVRALLRFEYSAGKAVADALRAAVVADALRGRSRAARASRGPNERSPRTTLRVRLDVPELDL